MIKIVAIIIMIILVAINRPTGQNKPEVLQETLHQLKVFLLKSRVWEKKDLWCAIDSLGSIALCTLSVFFFSQ